MSCLNLLCRVSSFALILEIFSTFIKIFLSFSLISEVNWFNWDSSFKKPESSLRYIRDGDGARQPPPPPPPPDNF